ncbi:MAG TPA: PEP-CTERM sorting domain-containing protein [Lacipirellula sp.]
MKYAYIALALVLSARPALSMAATVSLIRSTREVTPEEIADGAPVGGFVHDFFVSSDTDLLSLSSVNVDVPLFQHLLGSDVAPPADDFTDTNPGLSADSYIDTPGDTATAGGGFLSGPGDRAWFDVSNDGPLEQFHFARLTTGQTGSFSGRVAVRGYNAPVYLPFDFILPGMASDLPLVAAQPTYALEYSLNPPPPPVIPPTLPTPQPPVTPPVGLPPAMPPASPPATPRASPPANPPGDDLLAKISLTRQSRIVSADEIAAGAPVGAYVHEFYLNSATDLLSINTVKVDVPLFQAAEGSDAEAPNGQFAALQPSLGADSFITTPGATGVAGGGLEHDDSAWFDTSNDGDVEDFLFARLTVDQTGTFTGRISVRHEESFVSLPFEFLLPGNEADMALLAGEQTYAMDFPPTPPVVETPPTPPIAGPVDQTPPTQPPIDVPQPNEYPEIDAPTPEFPPIAEQPPVDEPRGESTPDEPADPDDPTPSVIDILHGGIGDIDIVDWTWTEYFRPVVLNPDGTVVELSHVDLTVPVFRTGWVVLGGDAEGVLLDGGLASDADGTTTFYAYAAGSPSSAINGAIDAVARTRGQAAEAVVPEPSTLCLIAGASACIAAARRRPRPLLRVLA